MVRAKRRRFYSKCFFPQGGRKCTRSAKPGTAMLPMHKNACKLRPRTGFCTTNKSRVSWSKKKLASHNAFTPLKTYQVRKTWRPAGYARKKLSDAEKKRRGDRLRQYWIDRKAAAAAALVPPAVPPAAPPAAPPAGGRGRGRGRARGAAPSRASRRQRGLAPG